jgi:hypothetical protein
MPLNGWRRRSRRAAGVPRPSARPRLEALEDRTLPATLLAKGTQLLAFDSSAPQSIQTRVNVVGLQAGEALEDIAFRPATGQLYGLSNEGRLYFIDVRSGEATQVGSGTLKLDSTPSSFDFDPVTGQVRIGTHAGLTLRVDPDSGALLGTSPPTSGGAGAVVAVPPAEEQMVLGPRATVGAFDPSTATWSLRNSNTPGDPNAGVFQYGGVGWIGVVGDWDGNGSQTVGVVDPLGDLDPNNLTWFLRNSNSAGAPDIAPFNFGSRGWIPVVGDWTGSGYTGIGAFDPRTATWYLRDTASPGPPDFVFQYGGAGWIPVVGDWNGDGRDTVGVVDPTGSTDAGNLVWYLRNSNSAGAPDIAPFSYGPRGWTPISGDWNGPSGLSTVGVVDTTGASNPTQLVWYLRFSNSSGEPDIGPFDYGAVGWQPVAGAYNFLTGL